MRTISRETSAGHCSRASLGTAGGEVILPTAVIDVARACPRRSCEGDTTTTGKVPKPLQRSQSTRGPHVTVRQIFCVAPASRWGNQRRRTTKPRYTASVAAWHGQLSRSSAPRRGSCVYAGAKTASREPSARSEPGRQALESSSSGWMESSNRVRTQRAKMKR